MIKSTGPRYWHWVTLLGLALCASVGASAQTTGTGTGSDAVNERWAVMSVLGDGLEMVVASSPSASRIDRGGSQTQNIPGSGFDRAALLGARDALLKTKPASALAVFRPSVAFTATEQREIVSLLSEGTRIPWLMELLQKDKVQRLFLITRDRGDALLRTQRGDSLGERPVDGVGFYVDWHSEIRADGQLQQGFLAPFVYLRVTQFDVTRAAVLRSDRVREAVSYGRTSDAPDRDPWNMMSNVQKVERLREMVQRSVEATIGASLKAP